ncbi:MAG: molybdopterin-dependent oxidoreductase [Rhodospirillum sp.]|nr:molybdopterin-dependent oxidoreductase [Rhodospirillum sp.]MCF8490576.1 molybdopterin-dependent oxidoreductase [Rhodospirillum sp.]MCF8502588.1 molybdopterin-dependent oxidoreductase [Rhodospirillum sp.]
MRDAVSMSRRSLLLGLSGSLLVAVTGLPGARGEGSGETAGDFGPFIRVDGDGSVRLVAPCFELGQGSHTGLAMILCDELGADWDRVTVVGPELNPALNVPGRDGQTTSGSQMIRRWRDPLRQAAAAAREMLARAAGERLGRDPDGLVIEGGWISDGTVRLGFGALVEAARRFPVPDNPGLRDRPTIVGTSVPRVDIPAKVNGMAVYGTDVRLPGMVHAAIRQAPVQGARLVSVARSAGAEEAGVLGIVEAPEAVMVIATTFWRAKTAVDALDVVFSETEHDGIATADIDAARHAALDAPEAARPIEAGDAPARIAAARGPGSGVVVTADYDVPFLHHATMEPMTCTARVDGETCEVWLPTQDLTNSAKAASKVSGVPLENVAIHATYVGGGFGRKFETDCVEQAVRAAMTVDRPVQLTWTREEDVRHGFYRPAMSARLTAAVTAEGDLDGFLMRIAGPSVLEHTIGKPLINGSDPIAMLGVGTESGKAPGKVQQYAIPDLLVEFAFQPTHVRLGYWRSVGASENGFFIESFMDELAHAVGADPYRFRRHLLRESPRALAVLDKVAVESGWDSPRREGRFLGIAFSECVGSMVAEVAEVSIEEGRPRVHRVVAAIDCGTAINPNAVEAQVLGAITMGLSAALHERITVGDGAIVQGNFHDYAVARMADTPPIDVHIVDSGAPIGGVGEAGLPAVAPAVCNAIFAATGRRVRSLPILETS